MTSNESDPYTSEFPPNCNIDPDIRALVAKYYLQVDTQGRHTEWCECWSEDGLLIVPTGEEFRGRDAIRNVHLGMWDGVSKRLHRPQKIFPFGDDPNELVIIGTVEHWLEHGPYQKQDMAARVKYQRSLTGRVEVSSMQVWLTA
ncbi:hypothetical protein P280DRAFT_55705 [Massarina eburnea CBS 473.64]|uniref:Uncharacterized protein n=1 Tax=Massarina eburnea CBS 473.64 TaxID=1395130 RepID=A0A6A6RUB1_9PLEO|nr:hypothetical protein P280DRAFT_55705 [Massarina eburnea CBS 473.64]